MNNEELVDEIFKQFGTDWFSAREYSPHEDDEAILKGLVRRGYLEKTNQDVLEIENGSRFLYSQVVYRVKVNVENGYE